MQTSFILPAALAVATLCSACKKEKPIPPEEIATIDSLMGRAGTHMERDSLGVPMVVAPSGTAYEYQRGDTVFEIGPLESVPLDAPAVLQEGGPRLKVDSMGALVRPPEGAPNGSAATNTPPRSRITPPSRREQRR